MGLHAPCPRVAFPAHLHTPRSLPGDGDGEGGRRAQGKEGLAKRRWKAGLQRNHSKGKRSLLGAKIARSRPREVDVEEGKVDVACWKRVVVSLGEELFKPLAFSLPRLFGFVARKQGSTTDNVCHLFAELDPEQPAAAIVNFVSRVMLGSGQKR